MYFTPEVEYEVISDEVSQKLDRTIVNPRNKVWRDSTQIKTPTSPFKISDSLRYNNERHNDMVDLVDINTTDLDRTNYSIKFLRGNIMVVTN